MAQNTVPQVSSKKNFRRAVSALTYSLALYEGRPVIPARVPATNACRMNFRDRGKSSERINGNLSTCNALQLSTIASSRQNVGRNRTFVCARI